MDCQEAQESILDEFEEPRATHRRLAVEIHVVSCETCRRFAKLQRVLDQRLAAAMPMACLRPGFRKAVTAGAVARLVEAAVRLVPRLAESRFEDAWSGLRPGTPDGWPILGPSPVRGLFFAAGHFRSGILLAPITARLVADAILGASDPRLEAFSIERFAGRLSVS